MRDSKDININKTKATSASKKWLKGDFSSCQSHDLDASFWCKSTGSILQILLSHAGYSRERRDNVMHFYRDIVRDLGPRPTAEGSPSNWQSYMTDDFSPIEFSWKWSNAETDPQPVIRFSIEAIGDDCGTLNDPYNKVASFSLINRLKPGFSNTDYQLFDHLSAALLPEIHRDVATGALAMHGHKSAIFLGFEFIDKAPLVKAYLLSSVKAVQLGISALALVCKALNSLATKFPAFHTLHVLADYFQIAGQEFQLEPVMVAIDCVCPRDSRMKVYARTAHTTFDSVEAIMSSFEPSHSICRGIEELRTLWQLVMGPMTEFSSTQELLPESHCTFGILYYFEVTANSPKIPPKIVPKIYLPLRHYGQSDHKVVQGLGAFLSSRDKSQVPYVSRYLEALQQICTYRNLDSQCGLQAYISCSIKDNSINVTSYFSSEICHHGRGSAMATWQ